MPVLGHNKLGGAACAGEHWDNSEEMDTYYNPIPHFTYQMALDHSPTLKNVRTLVAPDDIKTHRHRQGAVVRTLAPNHLCLLQVPTLPRGNLDEDEFEQGGLGSL